MLGRLDHWQRSHRAAAFGFAVLKKFGDDQGGSLAALLAYYGFVSLFPLLLVMVSVLGFVLQGHPALAEQVSRSALRQIPVLGQEIRAGRLHQSGIGLAVGLVGALYGGLGVAGAAQDAMNQVWAVPRRERPNKPKSMGRSLLLLAVVGTGVVATTVLAGGASGSGNLGPVLRAGALVAALLLNLAVFLLAFRILTVAEVRLGDLWPGAAVAAVAWQALQAGGGYYINHQLKGASNVYGVFAFVIVLLSWLALEAQIFLLSSEINVVRARRLWPRALGQDALTPSDYEALRQYASIENRHPAERVEVSFATATATTTATATAPATATGTATANANGQAPVA